MINKPIQAIGQPLAIESRRCVNSPWGMPSFRLLIGLGGVDFVSTSINLANEKAANSADHGRASMGSNMRYEAASRKGTKVQIKRQSPPL
jgi:hypothetical protein